jgi:hypothetical protein
MSEQSEGRKENAASSGGKPSPDQSDESVRRVGRQSAKSAGPDGPDATEVGDTFKRKPADR